jgi:hypothetical protein
MVKSSLASHILTKHIPKCQSFSSSLSMMTNDDLLLSVCADIVCFESRPSLEPLREIIMGEEVAEPLAGVLGAL